MTAPLGLTSAAAGIHLGQRLDPGFAGYWTAECAEISGPVDVDRLAEAIADTVRDAEALHARFPDDATQVATAERDWRPEIIRLPGAGSPSGASRAAEADAPSGIGREPGAELPSGLAPPPAAEDGQVPAGPPGFVKEAEARATSNIDRQSGAEPPSAADSPPPAFGSLAPTGSGYWPQVRTHIDERMAQSADPAAGNLFRSTLFVTPERVFWFVQAHHIVLDGFGYALLYQQVSRRYNGKAAQPFGRLVDLVADDESYRDGDKAGQDRDYWVEKLAGLSATSFTAETALPDRDTICLDLPGDLLAGAGPAWPHRLVALVAAALHRRTGAATPVLGLPVSGRLGTVAARVPAMVMNIAPVPVPIDLDHTVDDVTATVADVLKESRRHQRYRYEWLRGDLGLAAGRGRVFGPVVNIIPFAEPPVFDDCDVHMHHVSAGPVDDLAITARGPGHLTIEANPRVYSAPQLEEIRAELVRLAGHGGRVSPWRVVEGPAAPRIRPLPELIDRHEPGEVAIVDGSTTLTYGRLRERAHAVADDLADRGVVPGDLVAVVLPRGTEAIVAMLGVLYAGAGYLPLDPGGATDRNAAILAEAAPVLTIDADTLPDPTRQAMEHEPTDGDDSSAEPSPQSHDASARQAPQPHVEPVWRGSDPAYVIYTSGSTGRPKGVAVPRSALDFFVASAAARYDFTAADRVLQFAPLHFDAHVEEVFVSLACGATIVVRDDSATQSLSRFADFLAAERITVLDLPTAYWHELALALDNGQVALPSCVATVIIGGEAAAPERVWQWHNAVSGSVRLVNSYGPTEATVVCLAADLAPGDEVSLGSPLPGVRAAIGPADELYICGPGLALGYLECSAKPSPDASGDPFVTVDGQRWYRTGDIVAANDSGLLDYRGRADAEVKISGHRVHPGEVEAALLRHPDVREAVVTVERSPRVRLVAHVAADTDVATLREHAHRHLPEAAVPASLHVRDRLPRTSTGKIDRQALTEPAPVASTGPATDTERAVLAVFAAVLGTRPDREADFFAVGGTSLSAVAAATRLSGDFGGEVTAADLFAHPTAAELAALLSGEVEAVDDTELMRADQVWHRDGAPCLPNGDDAIALTGATGFVGSHILAALLSDTDRPIRCLVRGGAARLVEAAARFGLPRPDASRITVIDCDLSRPVLGLDTHAMSLVSDSQAIVNCAGNVSFTRGYPGLRAVNVEAVRTLLELACVGGGDFHQISTVSVGAGGDLPEDFITGHPGLVDGYQRGKWVAEELLRQAGAQGLPVSAYRLGRVVPPASATGHNPDDFVAHLIRAALSLGTMPDLAVSEPWIAADVAATCVVQAVEKRSTGMWNLDGGTVSLSAVWERLGRDHPELKQVTTAEWRKLLGGTDETAILKSFFDIHADGPPREHSIHSDRFAGWFADSGLPGPAWNLDWCALVGR